MIFRKSDPLEAKYAHHKHRLVFDRCAVGAFFLSCILGMGVVITMDGSPFVEDKPLDVLELQWVQAVEVRETRISSGEGVSYPDGASDVVMDYRMTGHEVVPLGAQDVIPELSLVCNMQLEQGGGMQSVPCAITNGVIYFVADGKVWGQWEVWQNWYQWTLVEDILVGTYVTDGVDSVPVRPETPPLTGKQVSNTTVSSAVAKVKKGDRDPDWVAIDDIVLVGRILSSGKVDAENVRYMAPAVGRKLDEVGLRKLLEADHVLPVIADAAPQQEVQ